MSSKSPDSPESQDSPKSPDSPDSPDLPESPESLQGDPKKMSHKDFELKSLLEVRFYFSTCVLESEFPARFIWPLNITHSES